VFGFSFFATIFRQLDRANASLAVGYGLNDFSVFPLSQVETPSKRLAQFEENSHEHVMSKIDRRADCCYRSAAL
jgi:hypothetical protein